MEDYQGIIKIKNDLGEFYTDSYVKWLESKLKEVTNHLNLIINSKNQDTNHYWQHDKIDYDSYADDDYDR
jgi:hypothetical protein